MKYKENNFNNNITPQFNNNYIFNEMKSENQELKQQLTKLQLSNMKISVEKEDLKRIINFLKNKENECLLLQEVITKKENEIEDFKNLILKEKQNYQEDLRLAELKYENKLLQMKHEQENAKNKMDNFNKMNDLNNILYSKVLELEQDIENLKKEEEIKLNNKELVYNNKIDKYKKRLIDFLKKGENKKDEDDQLALNNKLNILHIQELIDEIQYQNHEVNTLLREKKDLKIKILELINDLNIYKIMVITLTKKNDEYQKKLKSLKNDKFPNNLENEKVISLTENNKYINKSLLDKRFKIYSPIERKKNILLRFDLQSNNKKEKENQKTKYNTINNNTISSIKSKKDLNEYLSERIKGNDNDLFKEKKEKRKYKELYEFYKDRYDFIIKKYKNIFNMYSDALEKIYNEEISINNNTEISININDLKDLKFEQMSPEQKYSILIKLINHISPLICKNDFNENSFKENIFRVKQKYNISNLKHQSFSKKQKHIELKYSLSSKEKNRIESPAGCTMSTFFSPESKRKKTINNLSFNKRNSSKVKFLMQKGYYNVIHNLKIPKFMKSKLDNIHKSPFTYD